VGIGERARTTPDAYALIGLERAVTFADLDRRQRLLAGALRRAGLRRGDRVGILSANRHEYLEVTTGALRVGVVPVPIHALLTPPEAAYIVEDSECRWIFTDRSATRLPPVERVVTFGDAYERFLHESRGAGLADHMLGRPMHYTSGTTGEPKGVWVAPVGERQAAALSEHFRRTWDLSPGDVHLVCSPLSHSAPHRFAARTLEAGGSVVLQDRFDAAESLAAVELFGVTTSFMVPTHMERIVGLDDRVVRRHDLSSVRLMVHAGAPIRVETKRRAMELFPEGTVWEFYGSTEGQATRISPAEWLRKPQSVGKAPAGAQILITDASGNPLPTGGVGEIWIRSPETEPFEYWGDAQKTKRSWRDGAFTVGDLGRLDEDGYLYLTGRKHDTIISGGINVYPQEVEQALIAHPSVKEVLVFGATHDEWGQQVEAYVVPAYGQPLDPEALIGWARQRLAGYKCPRRVRVVEELPRTPTGKLRRAP
jgi:acyl-CoA synthetase (AMP-forming)/AMP-acid ligase II